MWALSTFKYLLLTRWLWKLLMHWIPRRVLTSQQFRNTWKRSMVKCLVGIQICYHVTWVWWRTVGSLCSSRTITSNQGPRHLWNAAGVAPRSQRSLCPRAPSLPHLGPGADQGRTPMPHLPLRNRSLLRAPQASHRLEGLGEGQERWIHSHFRMELRPKMIWKWVNWRWLNTGSFNLCVLQLAFFTECALTVVFVCSPDVNLGSDCLPLLVGFSIGFWCCLYYLYSMLFFWQLLVLHVDSMCSQEVVNFLLQRWATLWKLLYLIVTCLSGWATVIIACDPSVFIWLSFND